MPLFSRFAMVAGPPRTFGERVRGALRPPPLKATAIRTIQLLAALHLFTTTVAELRACYGFSMLPTLAHDGVWVVVSPIPYWAPWVRGKDRGPKRGDLVVADSPMSPEYTVCKRVIGIGGDVIEVEPRRGGASTGTWVGEEDDVVEDDRYAGVTPVKNKTKKLVERSVDSEGRPIRATRKGEGAYVRVPKGYVWLAGDNMSNSTDSRQYGPVPLGLIKGKVIAQVGCSVSEA